MTKGDILMMNENKVIGFSELIKRYRKEKKMTQVELSKKLNRNQTTVSNYEKGVHYPNTPEEIKAIAKLLNEPVSYIIDAIEYSRNGVLKEHEALLIDLDKLNTQELAKKYKFVSNGQEITGEQLKKSLELLKVFEQFKENDER